MFDFGFWELILVMLIALIVVGPKRLPRLAAQAGQWTGKMRAMLQQFRQNVQQEIQAEELKEILHQQQNEIQELRDIVHDQHPPSDPAVRAVEQQLKARPAADASGGEDAPDPRAERD